MKEISVIELQQSYFNPTKRETKKYQSFNLLKADQ